MTAIELVAQNAELLARNAELQREVGKARTRLKLYDSMKALMHKQNNELVTLRRKVARMSKKVDAKCPVPELKGTFPIVLYFGSKEDADEFEQAVRFEKPNMKVKQL
jgi:hypothetical protein